MFMLYSYLYCVNVYINHLIIFLCNHLPGSEWHVTKGHSLALCTWRSAGGAHESIPFMITVVCRSVSMRAFAKGYLVVLILRKTIA